MRRKESTVGPTDVFTMREEMVCWGPCEIYDSFSQYHSLSLFPSSSSSPPPSLFFVLFLSILHPLLIAHFASLLALSSLFPPSSPLFLLVTLFPPDRKGNITVPYRSVALGSS
jgi:hypothetical protein